MRRHGLLRRFGSSFTVILVMGAASGAFAAAAGASHRLVSHRGASAAPLVVGHAGVAGHIGQSDRSSLPGYTGMLRRFDPGSHGSSGWYQRGFGGTLDPGWGYNFGPSLGGSVR